MKLYIGSDHAGFYLKQYLYEKLNNEYEVEDVGPQNFNELDDYPDISFKVATLVASKNDNKGILICKNGVGVCISSNKVDNIRAVNTNSIDVAKSSRVDDNTNVLCLGANYLSEIDALELIEEWINTDFSNEERHIRRINKIKNYEQNK